MKTFYVNSPGPFKELNTRNTSLSKEVTLKHSRLLQSINVDRNRNSKLLSSKQTEVWGRPNMSVISSDRAENIHN